MLVVLLKVQFFDRSVLVVLMFSFWLHSSFILSFLSSNFLFFYRFNSFIFLTLLWLIVPPIWPLFAASTENNCLYQTTLHCFCLFLSLHIFLRLTLVEFGTFLSHLCSLILHLRDETICHAMQPVFGPLVSVLLWLALFQLYHFACLQRAWICRCLVIDRAVIVVQQCWVCWGCKLLIIDLWQVPVKLWWRLGSLLFERGWQR